MCVTSPGSNEEMCDRNIASFLWDGRLSIIPWQPECDYFVGTPGPHLKKAAVSESGMITDSVVQVGLTPGHCVKSGVARAGSEIVGILVDKIRLSNLDRILDRTYNSYV
jgi:hypothetical protein